MSLDYGRAPSPTQFAIGMLTPVGLPVEPVRVPTGFGAGDTPADVGLPCFLVNALTGNDDKFWLNAVISVHTLAKGNTPQEGVAIADQWAWDAHYAIIGLTMGDVVTLPNGATAEVGGLGAETHQVPVLQPYDDPYIVRYYARYFVPFRFV